jgi:hypothetical protein
MDTARAPTPSLTESTPIIAKINEMQCLINCYTGNDLIEIACSKDYHPALRKAILSMHRTILLDHDMVSSAACFMLNPVMIVAGGAIVARSEVYQYDDASDINLSDVITDKFLYKIMQTICFDGSGAFHVRTGVITNDN